MRLIDADATITYLREFRCKDCDRRKGMKNGKISFIYEIGDAPCRACDIGDTIDYFLDEDISPTIDVLALLKEQEAVKPKSKSRHGSTTMYQHFCGNCMAMLHGKPKYCPNCGRSVKWE